MDGLKISDLLKVYEAEIRKNVQEESCPDGAYMGADGIFIR